MWQLYVLALVASAAAQIPSLGWCPDYQPMLNFNMNQFLGSWYEAERYFTISELGSRCVHTKYESTPEGRILVSNEITNSLTGMKRVMDGSLQMIGREGEGRILVKYAAVPLPYENELIILDTDYNNYALMWSCSGIGPVHTQNAWILTRERISNIETMQKAYAALDKFKLSRAFFVKTNQADCNVLPNPAATPTSDVIYAKSAAPIVPGVEQKLVNVEQPVEVVQNKVEPEVKPEVVVQERAAVPDAVAEEPSKPMQVPELIMSESEKKEDKILKPESDEPELKEEKKEEEKKVEETPAL